MLPMKIVLRHTHLVSLLPAAARTHGDWLFIMWRSCRSRYAKPRADPLSPPQRHAPSGRSANVWSHRAVAVPLMLLGKEPERYGSRTRKSSFYQDRSPSAEDSAS